MLRLFDLSGHERFLKATFYGMTCLAPDCVMLTVSAREGVSAMTREHAALAKALEAPIFVVVTKIDLLAEESERSANDEDDHDEDDHDDDGRDGESDDAVALAVDLEGTQVYVIRVFLSLSQ